VLEAVRRGAVEPVASWRLAEELVDVLRRPKLARYAISDEDVDNILVIVARFLPAVDVDVPIRDPDDSPVVEAALAGHAEVIVTGDRDLLDDADLRDWLAERQVTVLTPVELLARVAE
jgi:putative PIN family toxin of toxin-antitoxin system